MLIWCGHPMRIWSAHWPPPDILWCVSPAFVDLAPGSWCHITVGCSAQLTKGWVPPIARTYLCHQTSTCRSCRCASAVPQCPEPTAQAACRHRCQLVPTESPGTARSRTDCAEPQIPTVTPFFSTAQHSTAQHSTAHSMLKSTWHTCSTVGAERGTDRSMVSQTARTASESD
jgi:hypothetical protein